MGSKPCLCIVRVDFDCPGQGDRGSCCGSDAFYRDTFLDEDAVGEESISNFAWEQARLKSLKGQVFLDYTKFSAAQAASAFKRRFSGALPEPFPHKDAAAPFNDGSTSPVSPFSRTFSDWTRSSDWLGKTMKEWKKDGLPPNSEPYWKKGDGAGLEVRCGSDYKNKRQHMTTSAGHMYHTLTVDSICSSVPLHSIVGSAVTSLPPTSPKSEWRFGCPLPRILCINVMLPHYNPKNPWAKDEGGCSYVGFFEITNETVAQVNSSAPPACVRMFRKFCEGPAGNPGCSPDHPDRSAYRRRDASKRKDMDPGLLRAAGWCLNQSELGVPEFLHQFNGKSFVIADSGYVIKDPQGEWLEVGFDVRKFPFLFVDVLYNFRDFIPLAKCHYGFTVQAVEDEDLPEGIICDVYISGISITEDPKAGRTGRLPHPRGRAVLVAHGRELMKVTKGFLTETGVQKWETLGWGSPSLSDMASMADPDSRNVKTWVDDLYSGEEKKKHRSEAAARLDAALGGPVRHLRKREVAARRKSLFARCSGLG
ncbi:unnamed protein product [Symbiodinium microadriaticum]|nr:unnamed protein product [Symbiodinium microadriaticum]